MTDFTITRVSGSTPTHDGRYVSVTVEIESGETRRLRFASDQLDWLANGLYQAAMAGYEAQARAGGRLATTEAIEVHAAQALPASDGVLLQIAGAEQSTRRGAISGFALSRDAANALALDLMRAAGE